MAVPAMPSPQTQAYAIDVATGRGHDVPVTSKVRIIYFRVFGEKAKTIETILDPILVELLFISQWQPCFQVELAPCQYPNVAALGGSLPALVITKSDQEIVHVDGGNGRKNVSPPKGPFTDLPKVVERRCIVKTVEECFPDPHHVDDRALRQLVRVNIGGAISHLLYEDERVWSSYTRPVLENSLPSRCGWFMAAHERRRQRQSTLVDGKHLTKQARIAVLFPQMKEALDALSARLGDNDTFGELVTQNVASKHPGSSLSYLDMCAFGHLAVLGSIRCDSHKALRTTLEAYPSLWQYCDRMQIRFSGVWPNINSFLAGIPIEQRSPAAVAAGLPRMPAGSIANNPKDIGHDNCVDDALAKRKAASREWWELWGWTVGHQKKPQKDKATSLTPPQWYLPGFSLLATGSIIFAICSGNSPLCPVKLRNCLASAVETVL